MTDRITREGPSFVARRRAASILTVPGLLAACGGGGEAAPRAAATTVAPKLAKTLHFSNWTLYIDTRRGNTHPSLDAVPEEVRRPRRLHRGHQRQRLASSAKIEAPLSHGQSIGRDIIVLTDNSGLPGPDDRAAAGSRSSTSRAIPNMKNLIPLQQHPSWDPNRDYSLPWQSGMTGIGYERRSSTEPVLTRSTTCSTNPKLKGKVTPAERDRRHAQARDALQRRRSDARSPTRRSTGRSTTIEKAVRLGPDPAVHRQRLRAAARKGRPHARRSPGRATSCSFAPTTRTCSGTCPTPAATIWTDNMLIPKGGNVYTASVLHELRLRARRSRPRSRTTSTTSARWSGATRCC